MLNPRGRYVVQEADGSIVPFNRDGYQSVSSLSGSVRRSGYSLAVIDRIGAVEFDATLAFGHVHSTTRQDTMARMSEYEASRVAAPVVAKHAPAAPCYHCRGTGEDTGADGRIIDCRDCGGTGEEETFLPEEDDDAPTPLPCHLIPTPNGRFAFVGRVPADLACEASDPRYIEDARQCGPAIAARIAAREGGTFQILSWESEADAYAYAAGLGYDVPRSAVPALPPVIDDSPAHPAPVPTTATDDVRPVVAAAEPVSSARFRPAAVSFGLFLLAVLATAAFVTSWGRVASAHAGALRCDRLASQGAHAWQVEAARLTAMTGSRHTVGSLSASCASR
ncbi:hypothetical protein VP06_14635 [Methylobacterium aquaticum]|uniref:Uncharacterized protein n=1 Tax=Methylobacterium aquaticum TaxID=270351 RepID=A0A0J6SKV9_9HYPH|nr:hypothetical protein VP06_14635 [Methylobacterium aquaticum]